VIADDRTPNPAPRPVFLEELLHDGVRLTLCVLGGIVFGVLDRILAHGPTWALDVSNVASFWLAAAFVAGLATRSRWMGAVLGLSCLMGALAGYYGYMFTVEHVQSLRYLQWRASPWVFAAMVVGPIFGVLGVDWRVRRAPVSVLALAAAFCLDGLGYALVKGAGDTPNALVHLSMVTVGLVLGATLLVLRRRRDIAPPSPGRGR
jgi:hypothetical protein